MKNQPFIEACRKFGFRNTPETLRYFYHPDHIGSTSWVTDSAKNGIQYCEYLPFGEPFLDQRSITWSSRYTFSGKERDGETGYSYFGARYYNSDISIWLSVDPMADKYPNLTPYAYCANNPIVLVDPDGKTPWPALIVGRFYPERSGGNAFSLERINPVNKVLRPHCGIDLGYHPTLGSLQGGEAVLSAAEGVVLKIGKSKSAGNFITIDHGNGYTSSYFHLQEKPNLKKGDFIKNEQEIGKVGSTGYSTGNHLHFEISKDGKAIDPTSIYDLQEIINPDNVGKVGYDMEVLDPVIVTPQNNTINTLKD